MHQAPVANHGRANERPSSRYWRKPGQQTVTGIKRINQLIKQNHQPMKQEVHDGIRRKQTKSFRHATLFPQDIERRCRGCRPRTCALGAVRVGRLGPNQDVENTAVESLRSPVRYLVRWLREELGKTERHHRHCRSYSAPRGTGARRGGGCGRGRT